MRKVLFLMLMCTVCCASCDDYPPLEDYGEEEYYTEPNDPNDEDDGEDHWIVWPVNEE